MGKPSTLRIITRKDWKNMGKKYIPTTIYSLYFHTPAPILGFYDFAWMKWMYIFIHATNIILMSKHCLTYIPKFLLVICNHFQHAIYMYLTRVHNAIFATQKVHEKVIIGLENYV